MLQSAEFVTEVDTDSTVTFTMQSRSADGAAQPVSTDMFTVLLFCLYEEEEKKKKCKTESYTGTGIHQSGGVYASGILVDDVGVYAVYITM